MPIPNSITDQIEDDFYLYYLTTGDEVMDMQWCGVTVVMTLPNSDKGSIEIFKGKEDITPILFPDKDISLTIPATAKNFFGVLTLIYKWSKRKGD
jgi:hypothetical protein